MRRVAWITAVEAVVLLGFAAYLAVATLVDPPERPGEGYGIALTAVVVGLVLLLLARGLAALQRWTRTPLFLLHAMFVIVAGQVLGSGQVGALPVVLVSGAAVFLLLTPEARLAFAPDPRG